MWETATMIMLGKYKQGEAWMEGAGACKKGAHCGDLYLDET